MTSQCGWTLTLARAERVECGFNELCHARCLIIAFYLGMDVQYTVQMGLRYNFKGVLNYVQC